ncbi:aminoglycoside phosphotransferase family protein [Roseisalinus antarcticus]|uniref:Phosphotransferase enzyme family protein n=1 Tax=Roseisalinus antarcticus TaxID=254357 RepID=A0A1Y5S1N9_9RHOB|nr:phosphotransferase [Roseisalinus antarcticus]SLN30588.1 Phosphotransferase enzyme family protein [Roseisalinus antarcticus]
MPERPDLVARFLQRTGHGDWLREPLPVDASRRRYERLRRGGISRILMDAPPEAGEDVRPFLRIADHLHSLGLAAPAIHHADAQAGLLILEDLGPDQAAGAIEAAPAAEVPIYEAAAEALAVLQSHPAPEGLARLDPETGAAMLEPLLDWHGDINPAAARAITDETARMLEAHAGAPEVLSLRDFHAENLIWRPERRGLDRVGLLDFQDAFLAPPAYDVASLLDDVRRAVSAPAEAAALQRFVARTGTDPEALAAARAVLSLQRNLRILGIFARLVQRDGKRRYLAFLPRLRHLLARHLDHPAAAGLRPLALPLIEKPPAWA